MIMIQDDTEIVRTAAMNQEIKRVLTEVLLKVWREMIANCVAFYVHRAVPVNRSLFLHYYILQVTDDLFDEIAQEVMDEDEQRSLEGSLFYFYVYVFVFCFSVYLNFLLGFCLFIIIIL